MALRHAFKEKVIETGTSLTLTPPAGLAYRVKDIQVVQAASASAFATVRVGRKTVGYWRIGPVNRNHLGMPGRARHGMSLFAELIAKGLFRPYPVAEGESLVISGLTTTDVCKVVYEEYDAADVAKTEPNGSESAEIDYIAYGTNASNLALQPSGYSNVDSIRNPSEMAEFPFAGRMPAKFVGEILGFGAMEFAKGGGGPVNTYTEHLRVQKEREILYDEDRVGFVVRGLTSAAADTEFGGISQLPYNAPDNPGRLFLLPVPLFIDGDEELAFAFDYGWTGAGLAIVASDLDIFAALKLRPKA